MSYGPASNLVKLLRTNVTLHKLQERLPHRIQPQTVPWDRPLTLKILGWFPSRPIFLFSEKRRADRHTSEQYRVMFWRVNPQIPARMHELRIKPSRKRLAESWSKRARSRPIDSGAELLMDIEAARGGVRAWLLAIARMRVGSGFFIAPAAEYGVRI